MFLVVCVISVPCVGNSSETCIDYTGTAPVVDYQRFDEVRSPVSHGNLVMFFARDDGVWSLRIVDADSPSPLQILGELAFSNPWKMWESGGYLYIVEGHDLVIVDVGNPADPFVVARLVDVGEIKGLHVHRDHLYVANHWQSMLVYDISEISLPQLVNDVIIEQDYVYDVLVWNGHLVARSELAPICV